MPAGSVTIVFNNPFRDLAEFAFVPLSFGTAGGRRSGFDSPQFHHVHVALIRFCVGPSLTCQLRQALMAFAYPRGRPTGGVASSIPTDWSTSV